MARIPDAADTTVPVQLGATGSSLPAGRSSSSASGMVLVIALWVRKVKGAILISIVVTTVLAIVVEATRRARHRAGRLNDADSSPDDIFDTPHFDTLGHFSLLGSFDQHRGRLDRSC